MTTHAHYYRVNKLKVVYELEGVEQEVDFQFSVKSQSFNDYDSDEDYHWNLEQEETKHYPPQKLLYTVKGDSSGWKIGLKSRIRQYQQFLDQNLPKGYRLIYVWKVQELEPLFD